MRYVIHPLQVPLPRPALNNLRDQRASLAVLIVEAVTMTLLPCSLLFRAVLLLFTLCLIGALLLDGYLWRGQRRAHSHAAAEELRRQLPSGWTTYWAWVRPSGHRARFPALAMYVMSPARRAYLLLLPDDACAPLHPQDAQAAPAQVLPDTLMTEVQFAQSHRSQKLVVLGFGLERPAFRQRGWTVSVAPVERQVRRLCQWEAAALTDLAGFPGKRKLQTGAR